jgi:hypothetical protein
MTTKHNRTCTMSFGRTSKHLDCPRCEELKNGAKPVKWNIPAKQTQSSQSSSLSVYCFSVSMIYSRCTKETNPNCACNKMSYTD